MSPLRGSLSTSSFDFDGGRDVTAYVPVEPPVLTAFAADGQWHVEQLADRLEASSAPATAIIGIHGQESDDDRLHEYIESFGGSRFAAFEAFVIGEVRAWASSHLGLDTPTSATAFWGASLGGELALAMGLRHPEIFGTVLCASPGGGFRPEGQPMAGPLPRAYLLGGTGEPWFLDNARRWADALIEAGALAVLAERDGEHGGSFWYDEFPRMVQWASSASD
ncbi:MAG: alpha/beta hydrolase-fold protein [Actinomycetota bacterium]